MLELRADPWLPAYGMGLDAPELDEAAHEIADPSVETADWARPLSPPPSIGWRGSVAFVDGVERVDLGLMASDDGRMAPGLFGSFAVGCVLVDHRAAFGPQVVDRVLITGGGMRGGETVVPIGRASLRFRPVSDEGTDPIQPRRALLRQMRDHEARLARELVADGSTLVLADGRLQFPDESGLPLVGFVKRFMKHHLPAEEGSLLGRLGAGERTPLFCLSGRDDGIRRYSWYVRLVPLRAHWHALAGLVRCEVSAGVGREDAIGLADRVTALLPSFAGSPADPRTPQNLAPVARLESELRRRMGDPRLIRRELIGWLIRGGGKAA